MKKTAPKYNTGQNIWFMIKLACNSKEKNVLAISFLLALLTVIQNLLNLYISPVILRAVEEHVSMQKLLIIIAGFVLLCMAVSAGLTYVKENALGGRISVRCEIVNLLNKKAATTSYPNIEDIKFKKLLTKSNECTDSNREATEAIWTTLTTLLVDAACFFIYAGLLTQIQPILILVIFTTAGISYFILGNLNGYVYEHREEEAEYEHHMDYLLNTAKDLGAAKDIRIFGLHSWLEELYRKNDRAFTALRSKEEGVYAWAKIADVVLTFLRNGVAYAYLIYLVLYQGLDISEFLLLFTAVDGFSGWVFGILENLRVLQRQSQDISIVRECLDYPEIFQFEEGIPLKWTPEETYIISLENVSFSYPDAPKETLHDINLTLRPGEKLAIVGLNGAGKTTLIM